MRWLALVLATLVAAVIIARAAAHQQGFVVVGVGDWLVEMNLVLFAALLVLSVVALYLLLRLAVRLWTLPGSVSRWRAVRQSRRGLDALTLGLTALAEGDWRQAERLLVKSAGASERPLLHYLGAAAAAQRQHARDRRDEYLRLAQDRAPQSGTAIGVARADLLLQSGQINEARAVLERLHESEPAQIQVLRLLAEVYMRTADWGAARRLMPDLKHRKAFTPEELMQYEREVYEGMLQSAPRVAGAPEEVWRGLPRAARRDPRLIATHAQNLAAVGAGHDAERLLRAALKSRWTPQLVRLYGRIESEDVKAQLQHAERWLHERGPDPDLLYTLGELCYRNRLWTHARSHLESALAMEPRAEEYQVLADVLEQMGEAAAAAESTRKGLVLATAQATTPANLLLSGPRHPVVNSNES